MMRSSLLPLVACAAVCASAAASSAPLPGTERGILALVKSTPALEVDPTLPNPSGDKNAPWVRVAHAPEGTNGGYIAASYAQRGTLADGTRILAVPLESGGSGGVFTQLLFAQRGGAPARYVGYLSTGGHLGVRVQGGAIVAEFPDYGPNDANCCPSHYLHRRYTLSNGRLRLIATWRTAKL